MKKHSVAELTLMKQARDCEAQITQYDAEISALAAKMEAVRRIRDRMEAEISRLSRQRESSSASRRKS